MPSDIDQLRAEARYRRERYDLARAKEYGGRLVRPSRLRDLERAAHGAAARLERAEADHRSDPPDLNPRKVGRDG